MDNPLLPLITIPIAVGSHLLLLAITVLFEQLLLYGQKCQHVVQVCALCLYSAFHAESMSMCCHACVTAWILSVLNQVFTAHLCDIRTAHTGLNLSNTTVCKCIYFACYCLHTYCVLSSLSVLQASLQLHTTVHV